MIRRVVAVLIGYVGFAQGLVFVVVYGFVEPLLESGPLWLALLLVELLMLGLAVGAMVGALAGSKSVWPARIVAGLCTIMMIGNIALAVAVEPMWFKLCVVAVAIPAIVVGERLLARSRG